MKIAISDVLPTRVRIKIVYFDPSSKLLSEMLQNFLSVMFYKIQDGHVINRKTKEFNL